MVNLVLLIEFSRKIKKKFKKFNKINKNPYKYFIKLEKINEN